MSFEHLAGRVWIYPHDPDPDAVRPLVALVADDNHPVLIDAGNGPAHAREIQQAIQAAGLPMPTTVVYTHHHWDHTWGACAWTDVTVVAHVAARELLTAEAARPWSHQYLYDQVKANPLLGPSFRGRALAVPDFGELRLVLPDRTFEHELKLDGGVELRHVGGNHAPDSLVAVVPDSGVMLLGDCIYPPPYHLRSPDDTTDQPMLQRLVAEGHAWYVDAHSEPWRGPSTLDAR